MNDVSEKTNYQAIIMAGGTGGHIFPGLAVANQLIDIGWTVHWLGSELGMETDIIGKTNIALERITKSGLRGNGIIGWFKAPFIICKAIYQARTIFKRIRPDVIIGFGGFVSGPGGIAAKLLKIPLFIHEQNAVAGMTNKLLSNISTKVFLAFPGVIKRKGVCETTGNPIRNEIATIETTVKDNLVSDGDSEEIMSENIHILVVGGSRGARLFNQKLPEIFAKILTKKTISILHQCGKSNKSETEKKYSHWCQNWVENYQVEEFIENMADAYRWADIVICRAGALTVSEIAAVGISAIFIPYPYAVDDHQTHNALWLVNQSAGMLIKEEDLRTEETVGKILALINNPKKIKTFSINAKKVAYLNATKIISNACEALVKEVA